MVFSVVGGKSRIVYSGITIDYKKLPRKFFAKVSVLTLPNRLHLKIFIISAFYWIWFVWESRVEGWVLVGGGVYKI